MPRHFTPAQTRKYEKQKAMEKRSASRAANERLREKRKRQQAWQAWVTVLAAAGVLGLLFMAQHLHLWR